jgi:hypothetical protein
MTMELNEVMPLWEMYDKKLEEAVKLNQRFIQLIEAEKVKSSLAPLFWRRIAEAILQSGWMLLLVVFLVNNFFHPAYAVSAIVLIAFFVVAFINSVKQLIIIKRMDYSSDIVTIQGSLAMLQANNLKYARMVILFIPACLAFPVVFFRAMQDFHVRAFENIDFITLAGGHWWTAQLAATLSLIPLGIWCYTQLSYRNMHKKWVRDFIERSSGRRVRKALEFMKELHSLKFETI